MSAPLYNPAGDIDGKIVDWRLLCFIRYGFGRIVASRLAIRRDVDRENVARLLERGATHTQVEDIVL